MAESSFKGKAKKSGTRHVTGKTHSMRLFGMRINVDWEEFQGYLREADSPAAFYLIFHDVLLDDEPFGKVGNRHPMLFRESDFVRSSEGYPELQTEIHTVFSGPELDQKLVSMVYTRDLNIPARWVFRNCTLSKLQSLWDRVKEESKETETRAAVDPRLNNFGVYQITKPFGKKPPIPTIYTWLVPRVPAYFDCHMHIQSNHCAPLPLVWEKLPVPIEPAWGTLDALGKLIMSETGRIGPMTTKEIGKEAISQLKSAVGEAIVPYNYGADKIPKIITPLPMDMDYGHFRGYEGRMIYEKNEQGQYAYYNSPVSKKRVTLSKENAKEYRDFRTQIMDHQAISLISKNRWALMPYYHYDPRRWNDHTHWQDPLEEIVSSRQSGKSPFIGIKLYTSLGYRPLDPKLGNQKNMYAYCERMEIPIMNHCTSEGMYTHEKNFYYDLLRKEKDFERDSRIEDLQQKFDDWKPTTSLEPNLHTPELSRLKSLWFEENYVHPKAWKKVAEKFPKLKVCLAHFMGNVRWGNSKFKNGKTHQGSVYGFKASMKSGTIDSSKTSDWILSLIELIQESNSFYSDISFFVVDKYSEDAFINFLEWARKWRPFLLDRILWGTDWPLLEIGSDLRAPLFNTFSENLLERLNKVDKGLWFRISFINPTRFLNINGLAHNLASVYGNTRIPDWVGQLPRTMDDFLFSRKMKIT